MIYFYILLAEFSPEKPIKGTKHYSSTLLFGIMDLGGLATDRAWKVRRIPLQGMGSASFPHTGPHLEIADAISTSPPSRFFAAGVIPTIPELLTYPQEIEC